MFINIVHHDLPSLFAGKIHAILFRGFVKGRDLYDLMWFLTKGVPVNAVQLKNAILQTEGKTERLNAHNLQIMLKNKIAEINFNSVARDLTPFVEDQEELKIINKESLLKAIDKLNTK